MDWQTELIQRLATMSHWGYAQGGPTFAEPTALASLALASHGQETESLRAAEQLIDFQSPQGCVAVAPGHDSPGWPTGWAMCAWVHAQAQGMTGLGESLTRATDWLLNVQGEVLEPSEILGHDVTLVGWPWVRGTHSWVEPTSIAILGLRAVGHVAHPRVEEARRLLIDRQLPGGGCNYGNTIVLGQKLIPHVQPTALALLALADDGETLHPAAKQSRAYLLREWPRITGISSLAYATMALQATGPLPDDAEARLHECYRLTTDAALNSAHALSLIALAISDSTPLTRPPGIVLQEGTGEA